MKVYTPANAIRLPAVTNKTDTHNIEANNYSVIRPTFVLLQSN
jgi:hypothetical protein